KPLPAMVGVSNFGPDLSRVALKLGQQDQTENARKWIVQWLLDPTIHSPRTLMPNTHLTLNEADDIAAWLLSQNPAPSDDWASVTVDKPTRDQLAKMTEIYLKKAGMVNREIQEVLRDGFDKKKLEYRAEDADEHELAASINDEKMLTYIGK